MLSRLIQIATGRSYAVDLADLPYALAKGGIPMLRGAAWSMMRLRRPRGFMLGARTQFLMSHRLSLGQGVAIGAFSYIDCAADHGIRLGDGVTIREFAWIQGRSGFNAAAEGLIVGARSYIGPYAQIGIGGPVVIGEDVQIGAGLSVAAESHVAGPGGSFVSGNVKRHGVRIGDRCWLGNNVTIIDGVEIGADSVIGAGSVVTRSIPPRAVAYGTPARPR
jgi:acetyltransferase-like isoleucine patch superfamily enzyme